MGVCQGQEGGTADAAWPGGLRHPAAAGGGVLVHAVIQPLRWPQQHHGRDAGLLLPLQVQRQGVAVAGAHPRDAGVRHGVHQHAHARGAGGAAGGTAQERAARVPRPQGQGTLLEAQGVRAQGAHAGAVAPGARGRLHPPGAAGRPQVCAAEVAAAAGGDVQDRHAASPATRLRLAGSRHGHCGDAAVLGAGAVHLCAQASGQARGRVHPAAAAAPL
mmetsp:Transcript_19082/g.48479  ORF Transcript_19082/g.48479 Transcript_19082/m.48479 type:complete len:217 (+) Transcript_19082:820-1470(+)